MESDSRDNQAIDTEPPTTRLQMDDRSRRPGHRHRSSKNPTVKRAAIVMSVLCIIAAGFAIRQLNGGVVVVVRNVGDSAMRDVAVHVTGDSYDVGVIEPSHERRVNVEPSGESHVEVSFVDNHRHEHRIVADCYFERRHYHGVVTIDIAGGQVVRLQDSVSIGLY